MSAFWSVKRLLALRRIMKQRDAQASANATVMPNSTGMNAERFFFHFLGARPAALSFFWLIVCLTTFAGASSVIYL